MSVTSIRIDDELDHELEVAAHDLKRSKGWLINEAVREYLSHRALENQRWQDTVDALEDIRMGRVVDGDRVHAWLESWGTNKESNAPIK